jgi:hypothetical protein
MHSDITPGGAPGGATQGAGEPFGVGGPAPDRGTMAERLGRTYGAPAEPGAHTARFTSTARPAPHELILLHELILRNAASAQKMQAMIPAVSDPRLRNMVHRCVARAQERIKRTKAFLEHHQVLQ